MTNAPRAEVRKSPRAARILLVEDNPADIYLLEKALQQRGSVANSAATANEEDQGRSSLSSEAKESVDELPLPNHIALR